MKNIKLPQPPLPLTQKERQLKLVKSEPPRPLALYLLFAALTSLGGLILGWVYLKKDGGGNKAFGAFSLLLSLFLPALIILSFTFNQARQKNLRAPLPQQPGVRLPR